jgi:hypothetical protein
MTITTNAAAVNAAPNKLKVTHFGPHALLAEHTMFDFIVFAILQAPLLIKCQFTF